LDDKDSAAWEEALAIIYHMPECDITWENAGRLLRLADKYDMRCIRGKIYRSDGKVSELCRHQNPHLSEQSMCIFGKHASRMDAYLLEILH
jgi:hypothetical protein